MESTVQRGVCEEKMHTHDERFSRDKERLDNHEQRIKTTEEAVILLTSLQAQQSEVEDAFGKRLTKLESRPTLWWDRAVGAAIAAAVSAAMAYLL